MYQMCCSHGESTKKGKKVEIIMHHFLNMDQHIHKSKAFPKPSNIHLDIQHNLKKNYIHINNNNKKT